MVSFLDHEHRGEHPGSPPPRIARVQVVLPGERSGEFLELLVDLDRAVVVEQQQLTGKHLHIDSTYMKAVEKACMSDERIQDAIRKLELPAGATVIVEP